jgi:WD40 repeat protein
MNSRQLCRLFPRYAKRLPFVKMNGNYDHRQKIMLESMGSLRIFLALRLIGMTNRQEFHIMQIVLQRHYASFNFSNLSIQSELQGNRLNHPNYAIGYHSWKPIMVSCSNEGAKLWKLNGNGTNASNSAMLTGHTSGVLSVTFHDLYSNIMATSSFDGIVKVWKLNENGTNAECILTISTNNFTVWSIKFHHALPILVASSRSGIMTIYHFTEKFTKIVNTIPLKIHLNEINSIAFHPLYSSWLVTGSDTTYACVWRLNPTYEEMIRTAALVHDGHILSVATHPSAPYIATGSEDRTAKIWKLEEDGTNPECIAILPHNGGVRSVAFNPYLPTFIATGCYCRTTNVWKMTESKKVERVKTSTCHNYSVLCVAWNPCFSILTSSSNDMRILNLK